MFLLDSPLEADNGGIDKVLDEKAVQAEIEASWVIVSEEAQRGL